VNVSIRRILIFLAIFVAEFAILEAGFRLHQGWEAAPSFRSVFMDDPRIGVRPRPGARVTYTTTEFSTDLAINAQGVRDDEDIGPKAPDERRVLVLGDSYVFAIQVPLAETFCERLERRLNSADPGHRWRVINGGVQGYGSVDEALFYRFVGASLAPDVVLIHTFVGNVGAADRGDWLESGRPQTSSVEAGVTRLRRLQRESAVLQVARVRWDQLKSRLTTPTTERPLMPFLADPPPSILEGLQISRRAFGSIASEASERGARTAVVLMPGRFQLIERDFRYMAETVSALGGRLERDAAARRAREALAPLGLPTLDLMPVLEAQPSPDTLFFKNNVHLTTRGHEVVADALFEFMEHAGLMASAAR
jgi:lysophospholipase L1-like esterase